MEDFLQLVSCQGFSVRFMVSSLSSTVSGFSHDKFKISSCVASSNRWLYHFSVWSMFYMVLMLCHCHVSLVYDSRIGSFNINSTSPMSSSTTRHCHSLQYFWAVLDGKAVIAVSASFSEHICEHTRTPHACMHSCACAHTHTHTHTIHTNKL